MTGRTSLGRLTEPQSVFVLRARPYLEHGQLVDFFSRETGLVTGVSRHSRSPRSALRALFQPFSLIRAELGGSSELKSIAFAELQRNYTLSPRETLCAQYLNELLFYLLEPEVPQPEIFERYSRTLQHLSEQGVTGVEPLLRFFELGLLSDIGYGVNFLTDSTGREISPDILYSYDPGDGFVPSPGGPFAFRGGEIIRMGRGQMESPEVLRAAKRLCRTAIGSHLGNRRLRSRELYAELCGALTA